MANYSIAMGVNPVQTPRLLDSASKATSIQNSMLAQQAAKQEMARADYDMALRKSRDALRFVRTPEEYLAWHESNHQDPVLNDMLSRMGVDADSSRNKIMSELQQPGGLERLIQQSAASTDQLVGIMGSRANQLVAQQQAAAKQARAAEQQAQINALIGQGAAPPVANTLAAPAAQAFPVEGAPVTKQSAAEQIRATYGAAAPTPTTAREVTGAAVPTAETPVPRGAEPASEADALLATIGRLRQAAASGNPRASAAADQLQKQYDLLVKQVGGMKASERFVPVGKNVFDRQTQQFVTPPTPAEVEEIKPKLEKGEVWNDETGRVEAVPGSKLYLQQKEKHAKSLQSYETVATKVKQMNDKINNILSEDNASAFEGNFGGYDAYATRMLPGENSNLRKQIDSLKSNMKAVGLELMRSGGSIGQMTEKEWPIVEQMLGAIDPVLGEDAARLEFQKIQARINNILQNARSIYGDQWADTQYYKPIGGAAQLSAQDKQALDWANSNPADPRAAEIKRRLGM